MKMTRHYSRLVSEKTHEGSQLALQFLQENPVATLASVDPDGNPHATVIYFDIDEQFTLKFTTKRGTKKFDNIALNDHVMLVVCDPGTQTSVQIEGIAQIISSDREAQSVFRSMAGASYTTSQIGIPPISKLQTGSYVAVRILPVRIRMANFSKLESGGYDMFDVLEFEPQIS